MTRALRGALARLRSERGYTVIEVITTLAILGIVITSLTALFLVGLKAETDMSERFQAQQSARLALTKMRREIHCASDATYDTAGNTWVTLTLGSYCRTGYGEVTWCAVPVSPSRYALHRKAGTTCNATGSVRWADHLTSGALFAVRQPTQSLKLVDLTFPVDIDPRTGQRAYRLADSIVLRNSVRSS